LNPISILHTAPFGASSNRRRLENSHYRPLKDDISQRAQTGEEAWPYARKLLPVRSVRTLNLLREVDAATAKSLNLHQPARPIAEPHSLPCLALNFAEVCS